MGIGQDAKIRVPSILWIPVLIFGALLFCVDVFQIQEFSIVSHSALNSKEWLEERSLKGFAINTKACRIPHMDPFDKNILKFITKPKAKTCNGGKPALYECNHTGISLIETSLPSYNVTSVSQLKCCYKVFWRVSPSSGKADNIFANSKECYSIGESSIIKDEFVELTCKYENVSIYTDLFSFVPIKNNLTRHQQKGPKVLNVLVVGLDATSRLNLHRQMPKTVEYLKKLGSVELLGYNKVADNTFPNLMPVLAGQSEAEMRNSCWPKQNSYFDKCHFVWKDYKEMGYATAYGEDSSWMGVFNYNRKGFVNQTTDYAYNYFNRRIEKKIGNAHNMNVEDCVGARFVYRDLLDYINKFAVSMDTNSIPYFGFFWGASLSHDYLNKPHLGDEHYMDFFKTLNEEGRLKNTALIFMSDHGIRWGGIRQTYQGRMEERLPFVIISLPGWFKERFNKAYKNLERNTRRLTTPFDLHETLKDLLYRDRLEEDYIRIRKKTKSRGISFFGEIGTERSCEDAGISQHWCTCQMSLEVEKNSTEVRRSANFAVSFINSELKGYAECVPLKLDAILNARLMTHQNTISGKNKITDYMVTLRTLPGEGVFEVTVRHSVAKGTSTFDVIGTVSRLNLYGNQSRCISDFHMKLYCFCGS